MPERIKNARIKARMSRAKLGELIGVSREAAGRWERPTTDPRYSAPRPEHLSEIARVLHADLIYLEYGLHLPEPAKKFKLPSAPKMSGSYDWSGMPERIRNARIKAGLSRAQLGEVIGVSRQAVVRWEYPTTHPRNSKPDLNTLSQIARIMQVDEIFLLTGQHLSAQADAWPFRSGDLVKCQIEEDRIILSKPTASDVSHLAQLEKTVSEWNTPEDAAAYDNL